MKSSLYTNNTGKEINIRSFMEIAITEMRKSIPEARTDGKINPKVGAVLIYPNGEYDLAHRGELRKGDHAEYTLLERKNHNKKVDDCILITTLEPCVKRNPPKKGCCYRITNARIKTVYVGIQDHDPTVAGEGTAHLEDHGVKVIMFDRDLQQIIEDENKEYLEQAKQRARQEKDVKKMNEMKKGIAEFNIKDLSDQALQKFITEAKLKYHIDDTEFKKYLSEIGVMEYDENGHNYHPTGMGILLFGKNPRAKYHQAVLTAHADYGGNNIEPKNFDQPLVLIPELVEEWLDKVIPLSMDTTSFKRKDIPNFPKKVLREAVINAIVHRDYSIEGGKASIEIDREKIVIKSPGAPPSTITLEQLNTFKAPSFSRNPILTYVFSLMDYMEEKGLGMKLFHSMLNEYNLPLPEYAYQEPFLTLTFPRDIEASSRVSNNPALKELNSEELVGYEFIRTRQRITRNEYQQHFQFDKKKAERHLKTFVELKLIKSQGSGPSTHYVVNATELL